MNLPDPLPTDPDDLEKIYQTYSQQAVVDEAELDRLMDARLQAWGLDPRLMTPHQIFGAMNESMNSMLTNLYGARHEAPDAEAADQMTELIRVAEQLRLHINEALHDASVESDIGGK
jgi:hypothetical protein